MARPIINSIKHLVQYPIDPITTVTTKSILLVQAVERTVANQAKEVASGAIVKAVYVELWLQNKSDDGEQIVTVAKCTENQLGPTYAEMSALFTYVNKKNILFTHQGLSASDNGSGPYAPLRMWIKIPRGKQRFGLGDTLVLSIANVSSTNLNSCGIAIYKEYT